MKKYIYILFYLLISVTIYAQGTIVGFTIDPANPSITDEVKIYVDVSFTSGGCKVQNLNQSIVGNTINTSAHHCPGMATYICNTVDTFNLGYLSYGNNVFNFTLTSGSGGFNCSPGIVPDDIDSISFFVSPSVGLNKQEFKNEHVIVQPNPFSTATTISINTDFKLINASLVIFDVLGNKINTIDNIQSHQIYLERNNLVNGIYFYRLSNKNNIVSIGKLIVE